ncbi:hypothetical protein FSP39_012137 [Pinctada imbricata]|uniref:Uncharacterized protein n=1 Tax=Pinctada imbricata TaxID=66713 RepID=A0AA88YLJ7_PINIB|nr:hypothetical protein FSP39_012137 [Pinctada imbricata]
MVISYKTVILWLLVGVSLSLCAYDNVHQGIVLIITKTIINILSDLIAFSYMMSKVKTLVVRGLTLFEELHNQTKAEMDTTLRRASNFDLFTKMLISDLEKEGRRSPTRPRCSINNKIPKHPMQKHKRRVQHETEKRHTTCKHQTQKTTHKPTRPMGNRCRLRTAISHASSKWCGYPGLRAHNPLTSPITQRSRRTYNCGVKQPPHCKMTSHKQDRETQRPQRHR